MLIHAPISRQAIDEMRIWARGGGSTSTQQNARTSFMSNSVDGGSYIDCGDYATWVDGMGCVHDEEIIVTPEEGWIDDPFFDPESLDEEDDSGGFYPPQPEDTDCEVAYGCGGGVGPGPVPEDCPTGQVKDADGNCIDEEEPCEIQDLLSSCSIDDENFIDCIKNSVSSYLQQHAEASMPGIYTEMKNAGLTTAQAAYVIATAQHESHFGRFMNEIDPDIDFYQSRTDLGNTQSGDGAKYIGRGYVQLTGRANYQYWGDRLGIDLINNPELAEDPVIAARILVYGMRDGTFTGRKLSAHINENETDYINARWIVNGQDRAEDIATIAENFENAIINCTN